MVLEVIFNCPDASSADSGYFSCCFAVKCKGRVDHFLCGKGDTWLFPSIPLNGAESFVFSGAFVYTLHQLGDAGPPVMTSLQIYSNTLGIALTNSPLCLMSERGRSDTDR